MLPNDFNLEGYRRFNPDIAKYTDEWLKQHYLICGAKQKRLYHLTLPEDFNVEVYRELNPDIGKEADGWLEQHFFKYGKSEQRMYKDPLFDEEYFIKENNIIRYTGYKDYIADIRQFKSQELKDLVEAIPELDERLVLVSHKGTINGATHSLYVLASYLKKENKKFIILETEINKELIQKYSLEEEDFLCYRKDPSLLYWMCKKIPSNKILFNSINPTMRFVMRWIDRNKLILFSREIKQHYMRHSLFEPDVVITKQISDTYLTKPIVQSPILLPNLLTKMDELFLEEASIEGLDNTKITIGMCGSVCARKNYDLFKQVAAHLSDYNFVWIGGESSGELPPNMFHIRDTLNPYKFYNLLDYFVLFSEHEPFGNVVIENLYLGNKVLTFKDNIYVDHKHELLEGSYFEFNGPITFDNAIGHIISNAKEKTNKQFPNSKKYVVLKFSGYNKDFLKMLDSYHQQAKNWIHVNVKCPYGFVNQLRMMLAGSYLVQKKIIDSYNQEWMINNHNNVDFLEFFEPLPGVNICSVKNAISSTTFQQIIKQYEKTLSWQDSFEYIIKHLKLKPNVICKVKKFVEDHDLRNALGVHIRRTCKTLLLDKNSKRSERLLSNEQILSVCREHKKIFLATDNKQTQQWFKQKLNECTVITYADIETGVEQENAEYLTENVKRHTEALHTIMDFLILKECGKFLGSSESSFSLFIKNWRNNPKDYKIYGKL